MYALSAIPSFTPYSTTFSLSTGSAPGSPKQTGQTFVLGTLTSSVEHPQKIFVFVIN